MKTINKFILAFAFITGIFSFTSCGYNQIIAAREGVDAQWANVENRYQERNDLIPNLVATVKGYAAQESEIFTSIADSRSKIGGTKIDSSITDDPEKLEQYQKIQSELSTGIGRLLAIQEAYPELKSNENFKDLQSQLEGLENRIATERKRYNDAAQNYNTMIQTFPKLIYAKIFHFTPKAYFKAEESASKVPVVQF